MIYLPDEYNHKQPTQPAQPSQGIEDMLSAQADALIAGQEFKVTGAVGPEEYALLHLASRLRETLVPVAPSEEFLARLKKELIGSPTTLPSAASMPALVTRWQRLPVRYRLVAQLGGLTLTAGLALLAARRVLDAVTRMRRDQSEAKSGFSYTTVS